MPAGELCARAYGPISRCGWQAWLKMHYLWRLWLVQSNSKHTEASFSLILMYLFALKVAQGPRTPKLAIFVQTTTTTDMYTNRSLYPLRMRVGVIRRKRMYTCYTNMDQQSESKTHYSLFFLLIKQQDTPSAYNFIRKLLTSSQSWVYRWPSGIQVEGAGCSWIWKAQKPLY